MQTASAVPEEQGKVYALVVGISDYKNNQIQDLKYASADARVFADYLRNAPINLGGLIELYDTAARKSRIEEAGLYKITKLVFNKVIKPNDMIILYLSGHGGAFGDDNSYFFTHDSQHMMDAGSSYSIKWIKSDIKKWVDESKATVLFFFDACRSATVGIGAEGLKKASKALEEETGEILFAASQGGTPALETSELKHGVFSYYLIEGLYGKADNAPKDGKISTYELQNYVTVQVSGKTSGKQRPLIKDEQQADKILFNTNERLLALSDSKLAMDLSDPGLLYAFNKGGAESKEARKLSELIVKFKKALKEGRLTRPTDDCAYSYFGEMSKVVDPASLEDYEIELRTALYDAGRQIVNNDLSGYRKYQRPSTVKFDTMSLKLDYDYFYYSDAADALDAYSKLKREKANPVVRDMVSYLQARQITLRYQNGADANINKALSILSNAIKQSPGQAFLYQALGMCLLEANKLQDAEANLIKASQLAPLWSYPFTTLGELYYTKEMPGKAAEYYERAINLNKSDPSPLNNLGDYYFEADKHEEALSNYRRAYARDTLQAVSLYNMGATFYRLENYDSCIIYMTKLLTLDSEAKNVKYYLGLSYFHVQDYSRAAQYLLEDNSKTSENPENYYYLYQLSMERGEPDMAQYYLLFYLELNNLSIKSNYFATIGKDGTTLGGGSGSNNIKPLFRGEIELFNKDFEEAVACFKETDLNLGRTYSKGVWRSFRLNSRDSIPYEGHMGLGRSYFEMDSIQRALDSFHKAQMITDDGETTIWLSKCYSRLKQNTTALTLLDGLLKKEPWNLKAAGTQVEILLNEGRQQDAIEALMNFNRLNPGNRDGLLRLAKLHAQLGKTTDATEIFDQLTKHQDTYYSLQYAQFLQKANKYDDAIRICRNGIRALPSNHDYLSAAELYITLAESLQKKGQAIEMTEASQGHQYLDDIQFQLDPSRLSIWHNQYLGSLLELGKWGTDAEKKELAKTSSSSASKLYVNGFVTLIESFGNVPYFYSLKKRFAFGASRTKGIEKVDLREIENFYKNISGLSSQYCYDFACYWALQHDVGKANEWLATALQMGFNDMNLLLKDQNLSAVRNTAEFGELIKKFTK